MTLEQMTLDRMILEHLLSEQKALEPITVTKNTQLLQWLFRTFVIRLNVIWADVTAPF